MDFYAKNTSAWEDWQHEYYWGAFYIFPPSPVMEEVNELRAAHDPKSAEGCKAHISLSDTLQSKISDEELRELHEKLQGFEPFIIQYGPLKTHPPYPGVTFDINPKDKFFALREAIHSTHLFANSPLSRKHIPPHMTIVEFGVDMQQSETLKDELQDKVRTGEWLCTHISLAVPNDEMCMVEHMQIPLGSSNQR
jgi:hypothetical protein